MSEELAAALDAATDRDTKNYVSPADSLMRTAEPIVGKLGWNK
jgi:hypothetical protein